MPRESSGSVRPAPAGTCLGVALLLCAVVAQSANAQANRPAPLELIAPLGNDTAIGFFIEHADSEDPALRGDAELCAWALDDWVRHAQGRVGIVAAGESDALIRVYFDVLGSDRYGEMRPILVGGRRGAEVYVRPETDALGAGVGAAARADPLMRETIVYLTCLHEIGHALGMMHTDEFEDVMYFFGFGGDIAAFFGRYRERLGQRRDIADASGLSAGDIAQLAAAYPEN